MKQIIQSYKTGKMEVIEVPIPACDENGILAQTSYSLISAGTEKMLIDIAKKSMLGKAKARPDLVQQVLNKIKKEGLLTTFKKVKTKLEVPIPLGYSCAGRVLMTGSKIKTLQPDDRVACAGAGFANHAEVNYIPKNLAVKIPDSVTDEQAAFTTLAAIALQGVRQCNPTIGEKVVVIGIGLIGLITVQLLKSNGCDVLAVDIDRARLKMAEKLGADAIAESPNIIEATDNFTSGFGADAVIITAASKSPQIVSDAGLISRLKGRVVMVGMTPINIPRDIYYKKELDFRLSMSYGPGRYDPDYEIAGLDYPLSYVRWTEQRNMETILNLIAQGRLDVDSLITHRFNFDQVLDAYKLINGEIDEPYLGVLLKYDTTKQHEHSIAVRSSSPIGEKEITIGLIGAGNFAQSVLLPRIVKEDCVLDTLVESNPINSAVVSRRYPVRKIASNLDDVLKDDEINTVFITTPHHLHSAQVIQALQAGKHVFVEKPLTISEDSLEQVKSIYEKADRHLMVGFNRRFSNHAQKIRERLCAIRTPVVMNYIVNAGPIPPDHWIQNPEIGGGRIIGEVCHFVDFMQYISNNDISAIFATAIRTENKNLYHYDSVQIILDFRNGSIGNITYHALGDSSLPKEYFEVSGGGFTAKLYDFKRTEMTFNGKTKSFSTHSQDKGFTMEYRSFLRAVKGEIPIPIKFDSLYRTTLTTFRILESIQTGLKLNI
jgi:predicted dehydrogenase/threonine dehydrogenase-like Zn-dependent dehydrogenase